MSRKPVTPRRWPRKTLDVYGAVHLLCNNAGVGTGSTAWESTINDWKWVIGVNLWGVLHGIRTFLPLMLEQDAEGYVINTASVAGLISYSPDAPYHLTKHAVVALSEKLYHDLGCVARELASRCFARVWSTPGLWTVSETACRSCKIIAPTLR